MREIAQTFWVLVGLLALGAVVGMVLQINLWMIEDRQRRRMHRNLLTASPAELERIVLARLLARTKPMGKDALDAEEDR